MIRACIDDAFRNAGLAPRIALSAADADIAKAYVSLGLGIAIVPKIAYNARTDHALGAIDASHLFEPYMVRVGLRTRSDQHPLAYEFIEMFAPQLMADTIKHQQKLAFA